MKKLLCIALLLLTTLAYAQIPHKTRTTLQLDEASPVTHADSLLIYNTNKIVGFISYNDFVAQLEATGISGGGGAGDPTNISVVHSPTTAQIISSTGTNGLISLATNVNSGLLGPTDKAKLDGLVNFDPSNYARKDIAETFASSVTVIGGLRLGNQTNYGSLSWYGGSAGTPRVTAIFDQATKDLKFVNYEAGGTYVFDKAVSVGNPTGSLEAVNINYFSSSLAGITNTDAFTPTADYHPATKKYVDDEVLAGGGYNDEAAQDAVGTILIDGSNFNFTYNDAVPSITGEVIEANLSITESQISDFGAYVTAAGTNIFTGANTFNELIVNSVTNAEIDAGATNVLITKDWYNNNLYHTALNIDFTPAGNTISTDVQNAIEEIQTELDGVVPQPFNDHFAIASDYTTLFTNKDQKGVISSGNIILDDADAGIAAEYQIQFFNNSASEITFTLGTNQQTKQFGTGAIPAIAPNQYAYVELISDNNWSIIVGKDAQAGGVSDHTLLTSIGVNTHAAIDTHISDATIHFTEASISITESQVSDLVHTTDTNTQLSQAQVGTYATSEGFIKTFTEIDPYWNAEETNVPRLNTSNLFTSYLDATSMWTHGGYTGLTGFRVWNSTSSAERAWFGSSATDTFTVSPATTNSVHTQLGSSMGDLVLGTTEVGKVIIAADEFQARVDPTTDAGVGDRGYNDARYYEKIGNPPIDGYLFSSTAAGVTSWVPPSAGGGGGDVSQYGTPALGQLAVWRGPGVIEGASAGIYVDGLGMLSGSYMRATSTFLIGDSGALQSVAGENELDLYSGDFSFQDNGVQRAQWVRSTGVFKSFATNTQINTAGVDALITKDYGDSNYGSLANVTVNNAKVTNATHTGDVTGSAALTIGANKVLESHLNALNTPIDEYFLTYESSTGQFQWQPGLTSGLANIVEDLTPQLGADLDSNGFNILLSGQTSIGSGGFPFSVANTAYLNFNNNVPKFRMFNPLATDFSDIQFSYLTGSVYQDDLTAITIDDAVFGVHQSSGNFEIRLSNALDLNGAQLLNAALEVDERAGATVTLATTDVNKTIFATYVSPSTWTVDAAINNTQPGGHITIQQENTGVVTIVCGAGVTINGSNATTIVLSQWQTVKLVEKVADSDAWYAQGPY